MSYLDAVLIAEARRAGRAQRTATLRHVHLTDSPLGVLSWQLGAEPFTAAAVAWGFGPETYEIAVPGEPRDRELAFRALTRVAKAFNRWFEHESAGEPQIVVPNHANLRLLGRLGRRLSYLPTDGERPADRDLVRFGRHLAFLAEHASYPGQQLVVVLTELLRNHWISELSALEAQHLPAMDAMIDPPKGMTGHAAAFEAEREDEIGPLPNDVDDTAVSELLDVFNRARGRQTDLETVGPLLGPIEAHYRRLVGRGWPLMWKVLERERAYEPSPGVARRWKDDVDALASHLVWVVENGGRYRTQHSYKQAAHMIRNWEEAARLLEAEVAVDDPLKMLPYLLRNEAVRGTVVAVDANNREVLKVRPVVVPIVTLQTPLPCSVAVGTELYWTGSTRGPSFVVTSVAPSRDGSRVVLKRTAGSRTAGLPEEGGTATFSVLHTQASPPLMLPKPAPWTHVAASERSNSIEDADGTEGWR